MRGNVRGGGGRGKLERNRKFSANFHDVGQLLVTLQYHLIVSTEHCSFFLKNR